MRISFLFVFALLISIYSAEVLACSCISRPVEDSYKSALTVFEGEIIDGMGGTDCGEKKMLMRVDKVYKGAPGKEVYVRSEDACIGCGVYLTKGEKYMVFARGDSLDNLSVGGCGATYNLRLNDKSKQKLFLGDRVRQQEIIDAAISTYEDNPVPLLKTKAEDLLYWQDYQQVEVVLRKILETASSDQWAKEELLMVLHKLHKATEIWSIYETQKLQSHVSKYDDEGLAAISFAAVTLGKEVGQQFRFSIYQDTFKNISGSGIKFRGSIRETNIVDSDFSKADFSQTGIQKSYFDNSNFSGVNFEGASLEDVRFNSTLTEASFKGARLKQVNFLGKIDKAVFSKAEIEDSRFVRTDFSGADLTDAKIVSSMFERANLKAAILTGVNLSGSRYDCETVWPDNFDPQSAGAVLSEKCGVNNARAESLPEGYPDSLKSKEFEGKDYSGQTFNPDNGDSRNAWTGKNLKGANFSNADVPLQDFSYSDLTKANFQWAYLQQSTFHASILNGADFSNAYLQGARVSDVKADDVDFSGVESLILENVEISHAKLNSVNGGAIAESKLTGAEFKNARIGQFYKSDLSGSDFSSADLSYVSLQQGDMIVNYTRYRNRSLPEPSLFRKANFSHAKMVGANLSGGDFTGATFDKADLNFARYDCTTIWPEGFDPASRGAMLVGKVCERKPVSAPAFKTKDLKKSNLTGALLGNIDLSNADLTWARLDGADFSVANLAGADLTMATFDCETKWPEKFDPLQAGAILSQTLDEKCFALYGRAKLAQRNLSGMNLFSAQFSKADLQGANLSGASMQRADLYEANMAGADLRDVDMSMANLRGANLKGAKVNCNTIFPRGFETASLGLVNDAAVCETKTNQDDSSRIAVQMLIHDWRSPGPVKGIKVENETLHWLRKEPRAAWEDVEFKNVDMQRAILSNDQLKSIKFLNSNLRKSDFSNSYLLNIDFSKSNLRDANFSSAKFEKATFDGADISGANFEDATLTDVTWNNVVYDCKTKGAPLPAKSCQ